MNNKTFTVYMYEQEERFLKWLVLQRQNIETGGDLFGLWQSEDTAIVQLIIGPGEGCSRTETSFHQSVNYLSRVGEKLTKSQGLCNIGEWHSHHRIGLPTPSYGDQTTVWSHMDSVAGGRFLVFIASIIDSNQEPQVEIGYFMFSSKTQMMSEGSMKTLEGYSPIRGQFNDVTPGPELGVSWEDFVRMKVRQKRQPRDPSVKKRPSHNIPAKNDIRAETKWEKVSNSPQKKPRSPPMKSPSHDSHTKNDNRETKLENKNTPKYGTIDNNERTNKNKKRRSSKKKSKPSNSKSTTESECDRLLRDIASPIPSSQNDIENCSSGGSKCYCGFIPWGKLVVLLLVALVVGFLVWFVVWLVNQ